MVVGALVRKPKRCLFRKDDGRAEVSFMNKLSLISKDSIGVEGGGEFDIVVRERLLNNKATTE